MTTYDYYGNPDKLTEFRLFVLNQCSMDCKGCFYKRDQNNFSDFGSALALALDLANRGYTLESCYLLPTDIFDNPENYKLFDDANFTQILNLFNYVGVASTLDHIDYRFFDLFFEQVPNGKIELQVNLLLPKIFDINYNWKIEQGINELKSRYKDNIVINLAINSGFDITTKEYNKLVDMMKKYSDDKIMEINFTFLFNKTISYEKKQMMLKKSLGLINKFRKTYSETIDEPTGLNKRTLLSRPAFVFLNDPGQIFSMPMLPFDEYIFIDTDAWLLSSPTVDSFIDVYANSTSINTLASSDCAKCDNLSFCMGKSYFSAAKHYDLGCFLTIETGEQHNA